MTKQNQLFEAIGSINDDIAANAIKAAEKSRRKRPLRITAVAAASLAAALALAVGIRNLGGIIGNYISPADSTVKQGGVSYEAPGFGESKMSLPNDSADDPNNELTLDADGNFWFNVYPHDIVIPDSFKLDETGETRWFRDLEMSPSDLFAEFGVSPLMNDNFTDAGGKPSVMITGGTINFFYSLYNKNINKNVYFDIEYHTHDIGGAYIIGVNKVISMKDGHGGIIEQNRAFFAYDGVRYIVTVDSALGDENDYIMDVLADLGVL